MSWLWHALNSNIVSAALGALLFGLVAAYLLDRHSDRRERAELAGRIRQVASYVADYNCDVATEIENDILADADADFIGTEPRPFRTDLIAMLLRGRFVEVISPYLAIQLAIFHSELDTANRLHNELYQRTYGMLGLLHPVGQPSNTRALTDPIRASLKRAIDNLRHRAEIVLETLDDRDDGLPDVLPRASRTPSKPPVP